MGERSESMRRYEIEYTTNIEDRKTVTIVARDITDAYLQFTFTTPRNYAITDMKEVPNDNT